MLACQDEISVNELLALVSEALKEKLLNRYITNPNDGSQICVLSMTDLESASRTIKTIKHIRKELMLEGGQTVDVTPMPATP